MVVVMSTAKKTSVGIQIFARCVHTHLFHAVTLSTCLLVSSLVPNVFLCLHLLLCVASFFCKLM